LLRLKNFFPTDYQQTFAGWNRVPSPLARGVTIHHPEGDIKKISTFIQPLSSTSFGDEVPDTHWEVTWAATANGHGVTEGGSSGSPLFNTFGQVVGTLTGGFASCTRVDEPDQYGKFSFHWDGNGTADNRSLATWLDPSNKGILNLRSIDYEGNWVTSLDDEVDGFWNNMEVYPNPNNGTFMVQAPDNQVVALWGSLHTLQGRQLWSGAISLDGNTSWQFSNISLPAGIYLFNVTSSSHHRTFKVIVE